jgi:hypothetical protein
MRRKTFILGFILRGPFSKKITELDQLISPFAEKRITRRFFYKNKCRKKNKVNLLHYIC